MSELKVVKVKHDVDPELLKLLDAIKAQAEAGNVRGMVLSVIDSDGNVDGYYAKSIGISIFELIGMAAVMINRLDEATKNG